MPAGCEVSPTMLKFQNTRTHPVWVGVLSGKTSVVGDGGFKLLPGAIAQFIVPPGWSGHIWARTGCTFDGSGNGNCVTGDCGSGLKCNAGGDPPVTIAEFTIADGLNSDKDIYRVSLVKGYNVGIGIKPIGGTGDCQYAGCISDLNKNCVPVLKVVDSSGMVVACKSECDAFNVPRFCCTGDHGTCAPTPFSMMYKAACPSAYYSYADASSTFTCSRSDFLVTFGP
ncbi:hypothetical protein QVD17_10463 [Tagetes erecta]|uniref:Thaumatin-like protein n=1 Tax=Tagetes erecta TaxID=13708 RepID=A0AAD8L2H5_TARER|nr:hypothetical protein QVD17_10463 [Tagetes erecta]